MLIAIVWGILGCYFIFLGFEILFLKKTKRIASLETHLYKNKQSFVFRLGLIEFIFGFLILASSILAIINYNNPLFTYQIKENTNSIGYNVIPLGVGMIAVLVIWINQKASEVKIKSKDKDPEA